MSGNNMQKENVHDDSLEADQDVYQEIPDEPEFEMSEDVSGVTETFNELLEKVGLKDKYPGKLTLEAFVTVKDARHEERMCYELFWTKLTSLDHRAGLLQEVLSKNISMRDFIFCILHCADEFLRQDILEKMSACQLAIPIIIQGINGRKPEFLLWALRRVMKKWKGKYDDISLEQSVVNSEACVVSALRFGNVRISKSQLLNTVLGVCQGNFPHSYYLSREDDREVPKFSKGSIECVWYLPSNENEKEMLQKVTAFFNLRGDCSESINEAQTVFACKTAILTIVLVNTNKREEYIDHICKVRANSKHKIFISVKEKEDNQKHNEPIKQYNQQQKETWIFVNSVQLNVLSKLICKEIVRIFKEEDGGRTLEYLAYHFAHNIIIDEQNTECFKARQDMNTIFQHVDKYSNVLQFKKESFPLQSIWNDLVKLDKTIFEPDSTEFQSFEHQRSHILKRKTEKRKLQLQMSFSDTMQKFYSVMSQNKTNHRYIAFIWGFLQERIFTMVNRDTCKDMRRIVKLEEQIRKHDKDITSLTLKIIDEKETDQVKELKETLTRVESTRQAAVVECNEIHKTCKANDLGCEHFLREVGQLYEAFKETKNPQSAMLSTADIELLPDIVANLVLGMTSLEIMNGDTGSVPLTWVTSVFNTLRHKLGDVKVLVISVMGVQSSGKSTLLNSMFGLRFPVRAGRCTRGLFIRFLKVDTKLADELGFSYLIVVDTEGIRSIDHDNRKYDNELVTFALSIANVTIFNIEGENIGTDMAEILQIAAHALMRMKEVDLECKCKILQQRVSDLTAVDRNKANTAKIKETLDKATQFAAEEEGLEGRYGTFSDVVDLRIDEDLQYIPCLWTGGMSPPNHLYSEKVSKVREGLFRDIRNKTIIPDLTLSTFAQRVCDVRKAVKEENFIFNFQDSVRAVDYNQFCLHYNVWVLQMRQAISKLTKTYCRSINSWYTCETTLDEIKPSLENEVEKERETIYKCINEYVQHHPRKNMIERHKKGFLDDARYAIKDVMKQSIDRIEDEFGIKKLLSNIPELERKWCLELVNKAKAAASIVLENDIYGDDERDNYFDEQWEKWVEEIKLSGGIKTISPAEKKTLCERLLLKMTRDMAIGSDINNLIINEGGIDHHINLTDGSKYIHEKFAKAWIKRRRMLGHKNTEEAPELETAQHIVDEKAKAMLFLNTIVETNIRQLYSDTTNRFEPNVYQVVVRKTIKELSAKRDGFKLPYTLVAKGLLHFCSRAYNEIFKNIEKNLFYDINLLVEYDVVKNMFQCFFKQTNREKGAAEFIFYYIHKDWEENSCDFIDYIDIDITEYLGEPMVMPWDFLKYHYDCLAYGDTYSSIFYGPQNDFSERVEKYILRQKGLLPGSPMHELIDLEKRLPQTSSFQEWLEELDKLFHLNKIIQNLGALFDITDFLSTSNYLKILIEDYWLSENLDEIIVERMWESIDFYDCFGSTSKCDQNCPLCDVPCDNFRYEHTVHYSHLHRPRGLCGEIYPENNKFVLEDCSTSVTLKDAIFGHVGKFGRPKKRNLVEHNCSNPCRKYKTYYPNWDIRPSTDDPGKLYWQWVTATYYKSYYRDIDPSDIPESWFKITKEDALQSLEDDKIYKTQGRLT